MIVGRVRVLLSDWRPLARAATWPRMLARHLAELHVCRRGHVSSGIVTVLQSYPTPQPTTNPYIKLLDESLRQTPGLRVLTFSYARALFRRYDVFHTHWPEYLLDGRSPWRSAIRQLLFLAVLVRQMLAHPPVVQTVHNLKRAGTRSYVAEFILRRLERRTAVLITLNPTTPADSGVPAIHIPLGHNKLWFADHQVPVVRRGRIGYFGLVRANKGVVSLIEAFTAINDAGIGGLTLAVAGSPDGPELAQQVREAAGEDSRVEVRLGYLSDRELVEHIGSLELVVLPYSEMHNSSAALTALSLCRPILVPDAEVNRLLAAEVGEAWVLSYRPPLTPGAIVAAVRQCREHPAEREPVLDARDWAGVGAAHLAAYQQALGYAALDRDRSSTQARS